VAEMGIAGRAAHLGAACEPRAILVLVDSVAMVVAVGNRTVVTALPHDDATPAVFTNIDAAVIT